MTANQAGLYWREWSKAHKASPAAERHDLHIQALGEDKSHLDFDNDDFDKVLAAFRAVSQPGNLNAQLHALNGQRKRLLFGIRNLASSLDAGEAYLQGIIDRMDAHRGDSSHKSHSSHALDDWERERERSQRPQRKLEDLHPRDLTKVMIALRKQQERIEQAILWRAVLLRIAQMTGFLLPLRRHQPRAAVCEPVEALPF